MAFGFDRKEFRRHCEKLLDQLPIRAPFELTRFLDEFGQERGTPMVLWRMNPNDTLPSGMVVPTADGATHIYVVRGTPPGHVAHIVAHEIGHLVLGHDWPTSLCGTTHHDEERQAELFADQFTARVRLEQRRHRFRGGLRQVMAAFASHHQLHPARA